MRVAVYARRSQAEKGADLEDKSTQWQLANARAFAAERGWTVVAEYIDEALSGRNVGRLIQRARLAADAEAGKFQAVIARNVDRLSRDDREGASFVYELDGAGVQAWEYSTRSLIDVSTPQSRLMLNMRFTFATTESENASSRTHEQKVDRMKAARLNDGRVLGYENFGDAKRRERRINQDEATLVRGIFQRAAEGAGFLRIAKELNQAGVVNPTGQSRTFTDRSSGLTIVPRNAKVTKTSWSQTSIRAILFNQLYAGVQYYGRTDWCWGDGACSRLGATLKSGAAPTCPTTPEGQRLKHKYNVPEARWLRADRPELRIIEQPLWDAAHARLDRARALFITRTADTGRLNGRPKVEGGLESKYLLSGFLVCAACGGRMMVTKRTSRRGRPTTYYVCSTHRNLAAACGVAASLGATEAHDRVTGLFLDKVLTPDALQQAVDTMVKRGNEAELIAAQKAPHLAQVAQLDREISNFTAALGLGGPRPEAVLAALAERETARKAAAKELAALDAQERAARDFDAGAAEKKLRSELKTWRDLLERDPTHDRAVLRQLLLGPIEAEYSEASGWHFYGTATLNGLVSVVLDVPVSTLAADEIKRMGLTPEQLGDMIKEQVAAMRAKRLAGLDSAEESSPSTLSRPSCPRGDSNTRHAV